MRVTFVASALAQYRVPFHNSVRARLRSFGLEYNLVCGQPTSEYATRRDTVHLDWAVQVRNISTRIGQVELIWQPIFANIRHSDLIIIGQENRLLFNYLIQSIPRKLRPLIGLWGHGRNLQSRSPRNLREFWKRRWLLKCDWWFAYTEQTKHYLLQSGFPDDRITVFNNSVDTARLTNLCKTVSGAEDFVLKHELGLSGNNIAIFVGSLHPDKRLEFLVESCDTVRSQIPDFQLLVVGDGPYMSRLQELASRRPWIKVVGAKFDLDKVRIMRLARIYLMPGLLGLGILDAAALSLPVVTTSYPFHSPEIAYLDSGENGIIVDDWQSPSAYAGAIVQLLSSPQDLERLAAGAKLLSEEFTIDRMSQKFVDGALRCLSTIAK